MYDSIANNINTVRSTLPANVTLVCVSKYHSAEDIQTAYNCGERDFAESRAQELLPKALNLPADIRWHFIGHLQTNKVRQILPYVSLIQSVDSLRLLEAINKEAQRIQRRVDILLEVHVAAEQSKTGFDLNDLPNDFTAYPFVNVRGIMGMATNTDNQDEIRRCFRLIASVAQHLNINNPIISMGMSDDYQIAISEGATMVRLGSTIFNTK